MAPSLAQIIIPQALLPEPNTGMCTELSTKQQDPKAIPLCQGGFCPEPREREACLAGGFWSLRNDNCSLFLLCSPGPLRHIHTDYGLLMPSVCLDKLSTEYAVVN